MLKDNKVQEWIFDEVFLLFLTLTLTFALTLTLSLPQVRKINDIDFRFKEQETPYNYVSSIAQDMHLYPPEHVLCAPHVMPHYNPEIITEVLNRLSLSNLRYSLSLSDRKSTRLNSSHT